MKDEKETNRYNGEFKMAVLAKPRNSAFFIDESKTSQFLKDSKKNTVTKDFLNQCKESSNLFRKMDLSRKK